MLMKMHIGSFLKEHHIAVSDMIEHIYLIACPCYEELLRKDLKYILFVCRWFSNQKFLKLDDLTCRFKNLQDNDIRGVKSHVNRNMRVQITVDSTTYLPLIIHICAGVFKSLAS